MQNQLDLSDRDAAAEPAVLPSCRGASSEGSSVERARSRHGQTAPRLILVAGTHCLPRRRFRGTVLKW